MRAHHQPPGRADATPREAATKRGIVRAVPGWGLRVRTRGDDDPLGSSWSLSRRGVRANPTPEPRPPPRQGASRTPLGGSLVGRASFVLPDASGAESDGPQSERPVDAGPVLRCGGDDSFASDPADRRARAPGPGPADLDHRSLQLPLHLLHAGRGHGLAAPRPAPHLRGDRPRRPGLRRPLRVRGHPAHGWRAADPGPHRAARRDARTARRRPRARRPTA